MVEELYSGGCIPCIPRTTALNRPLATETRATARAGARNNTIQAVASPTTSPIVGLKMDPNIHPTRPSQPSSLPHPQVIVIIFELHSISRTRTVHGTSNTIIRT